MIWPRLIPILTIISDRVEKTTRFSNPVYVGDPLNSVSLFSQLNADELIVLDISSCHSKPAMTHDLISRIIDHASLPISFGGGLRTLEDAKFVFDCGYDKVVLRTLSRDLNILTQMANFYGSQAVAVCLDIQYELEGNHWSMLERPELRDEKIIRHARDLVSAGVGEIIVQDVLRDGTREGLRKSKLVEALVDAVDIPIVVAGGCRTFDEAAKYIVETRVHSVAGSQMFLYKQPRNALLLNYPPREQWISSLSVNS
jgi:cyclase